MPRPSSDAPSKAQTLIVGIDFGTTFSGVSWSAAGRPIQVITRYESLLNGDSPIELGKVATRIHYPNDFDPPPPPEEVEFFSGDDEVHDAHRAKNVITWGGTVPLNRQPLEWFKLLLLDENDLEMQVHDRERFTKSRDLIHRLEKEPLYVVADYLSFLWKYALRVIADELGQVVLDSLVITAVISVPAIWKSYTRSRMQEAAKAAGILRRRPAGKTQLRFISEPEAAILATVSDMQPCNLDNGDCVTVVDAGGGTVDLISYQSTDSKKYSMMEIVEGQGGLCGAMFLDAPFENFMKGELGEDVWNRIPGVEMARFLDREWENGVKRQFDGRTRSHYISLPGSFVQLSGRTHVILPADRMKQIFDTVVPQIEALVLTQVQRVKEKTGKPPKYVVLVGGFGQSKYLLNRIRAILKSEALEVLQAGTSRPRTAISRGAVISERKGIAQGHVPSVESRIARSSYGFPVDRFWVDGLYDERDKYLNVVEEVYRARSQMQWVIEKGTRVSEKEPIRENYCWVFSDKDISQHEEITLHLHVCDDQEPPSRLADGNITKLCAIKFTTPMPKSEMALSKTKSGKTYRRFSYEFRVVPAGSSIDITIHSGGKQVAAKNVRIKFDENAPGTKPVHREAIEKVTPQPGELVDELSDLSLGQRRWEKRS